MPGPRWPDKEGTFYSVFKSARWNETTIPAARARGVLICDCLVCACDKERSQQRATLLQAVALLPATKRMALCWTSQSAREPGILLLNIWTSKQWRSKILCRLRRSLSLPSLLKYKIKLCGHWYLIWKHVDGKWVKWVAFELWTTQIPFLNKPERQGFLIRLYCLLFKLILLLLSYFSINKIVHNIVEINFW